jgi:hypothetical protein
MRGSVQLLVATWLSLFLAACAAGAGDATDTAEGSDVAPEATADVAVDAPAVDVAGPKPTTGLVTNQRIAYSDGLHNENTDLASWQGALWLVFRGGETGQTGSPEARLKVFRSDDLGDTWTMTAEIFMPDRDIRDPKFLVQDGRLVIYAISRVPGGHLRDLGGLAWTVRTESTDGVTWTGPPVKIYDELWGFWRFARHGDLWYATGYNDGDTQVGLFSSPDGLAWQKVSLIFDSEPDVPSEAELRFFGDTAVSLVRLDNGESLVAEGHTAVCVAEPPYATWNCGRQFDKRLDGPVWFEHDGRQLVVARKHLPLSHKRTALYEITGDLADPQAPLQLTELVELQSAGDTAYASVVPLGGAQYLVSWYSSVVAEDPIWAKGMITPSDIWLAWLDLSK